jgi:hypothetical protein
MVVAREYSARVTGPGLGGHCIPIDPFHLSWKARASGFEARFIELAGHVNGHMPEHVVDLVGAALNRQGKSARGARVLVLGVAHKADVDDVRESPSLDILEKLRERGAYRVQRPARAEHPLRGRGHEERAVHRGARARLRLRGRGDRARREEDCAIRPDPAHESMEGPPRPEVASPPSGRVPLGTKARLQEDPCDTPARKPSSSRQR